MNIVIIGPTGSGKTTVAALIRTVLRQNGYVVETPDIPTEKELDLIDTTLRKSDLARFPVKTVAISEDTP